MRGLLVVALLTLPPLGVADGGADVLVRIEGLGQTLWRGTVYLEGLYTLTAHNSGRSYLLESSSPLGALAAAARAGGFEVLVTDAFVDFDFSVDSVAGERFREPYWWDYRVDYVSTYFGPQRGWEQFGAPLASGQEVVWYQETIGVHPLRLRATASAPIPDGCAHAMQAEVLLPDLAQQPGRAPPPSAWMPAPLAEVRGVSGMVVGGLALASVPRGGATAWADSWEGPLAFEYLRSDKLALPC